MFKVLGYAAAIVTAVYAGYNADVVIDKVRPVIADTYHAITYTAPKPALEKCYKRALAKMDFRASCVAEFDRVAEAHGIEEAFIYANQLAIQGAVDLIKRMR